MFHEKINAKLLKVGYLYPKKWYLQNSLHNIVIYKFFVEIKTRRGLGYPGRSTFRKGVRLSKRRGPPPNAHVCLELNFACSDCCWGNEMFDSMNTKGGYLLYKWRVVEQKTKERIENKICLNLVLNCIIFQI